MFRARTATLTVKTASKTCWSSKLDVGVESYVCEWGYEWGRSSTMGVMVAIVVAVLTYCRAFLVARHRLGLEQTRCIRLLSRVKQDEFTSQMLVLAEHA